MSTEKLSELSKPVAYTDADELRFHHATSDMWPVPLGFGKDVSLYSQEYVSALLAELEAKDKRIAELEINEKQMLRDHYCAEDVLARQRNDYESALEGMYEAVTGKCPAWGCGFGSDEAVKEVAQIHAELEAKLATPVRLPGSFYPDGDIDCPLVVELYGAIEAIRAAGFTVEGGE